MWIGGFLVPNFGHAKVWPLPDAVHGAVESR
jgi:hypothetical protein